MAERKPEQEPGYDGHTIAHLKLAVRRLRAQWQRDADETFRSYVANLGAVKAADLVLRELDEMTKKAAPDPQALAREIEALRNRAAGNGEDGA